MDGSFDNEHIGIIKAYFSSNAPIGYLPCNGSTFDETIYVSLYTLLGTNVTPDLRECVLVGIGQNTTDSITSHDTYTVGEFKDDQLQDHIHSVSWSHWLTSGGGGNYYQLGRTNNGDYGGWTSDYLSVSIGGVTTSYRRGSTTRTKQKGVNYIIKAL